MARRQHDRCPFSIGLWHAVAGRSSGKYPKSNDLGLDSLQLNGKRQCSKIGPKSVLDPQLRFGFLRKPVEGIGHPRFKKGRYGLSI